MFDKKQKRIKCIHLVTDDGLYDRKTSYKVKIFFLFILSTPLAFDPYDPLISCKTSWKILSYSSENLITDLLSNLHTDLMTYWHTEKRRDDK